MEAALSRVVYFDHARATERQEGFGTGEAGVVRLTKEGFFESDTQVVIGANAYHALLGHGVVGGLAELPLLHGPLGGGRDAILEPGGLDRAAHLLYEADRRTYGRTFEFLVGEQAGREYRIVIDNRAYQRTLARLQFLITSASRGGHAVRLRLP